MHAHLDDFLLYISSEKGLSKHTIEAYRHDTFLFLCFLEKNGIFSFESVESIHIVNFLADLKAESYAVSKRCRRLIAIKVLFRFLKREGVIKANPAYALDSPKLWQLIPDVLSLEEVERLLAQPDSATSLGARDQAILELMYASGLRVSEVCRLGIHDVDDETVRIFGKGSKERIVPLGKKALAAIDHYLSCFRCKYESEKETSLFVTQRGKPLDRVAIWRMVKLNAQRAGIKKNIFPHTLRHTFATHLLDNGAELRVIQEMLGHASISSTDRYTHVSRSHLQERFDACHPRGGVDF